MTPEELTKIVVIEQDAEEQYKHTVRVCTAAGCLSSRADLVKDSLEKEVARSGLERQCQVKGVGCMGLCAAGPLVSIEPAGLMYRHVQSGDAPEIVASLERNEPVKRLQQPTDIPFFTRQTRIVLENSGVIDPERIEQYIARDGYAALLEVLSSMSPAEVIDVLTRSGLRGRGGAGFPAGLKWGTVAKSQSQDGRKFVICNADEGDPGAFMDRSVLESDPHRVLEGMAIAGYAVGATQGYIYVRAEYPLAIKRLKQAIKQADRLALIGPSIFGTPFSFNVEIRLGAGAFVCGEETALIASIEGKRGQPRPRPPFPAERGLWGCPTLINNVETLANVPTIIRRGPEWFTSIGTEKSRGTKVFALAGKVKNTGLVEVPMGTTLRDIIFQIGDGIPDGHAYKAVQTGGPSGGCIPEQFLDMTVDYESIARVGSIMGSGGMIVMDDTSNMVDVARFFMEFCKSESCGKCVPCRVGTSHMYDLLQKILDRRATARDLQLLEELCDMVRSTSLCGLGMSAPNPTLTTLRYFRHEYDELLLEDHDDAAAGSPNDGPVRELKPVAEGGQRTEVK